MLGIEDDLVKTAQDLDAIHYLRITVDVSGYHSPLKAELIPHWEQAKKEGCTKQITVVGAETISLASINLCVRAAIPPHQEIAALSGSIEFTVTVLKS